MVRKLKIDEYQFLEVERPKMEDGSLKVSNDLLNSYTYTLKRLHDSTVKRFSIFEEYHFNFHEVFII